jgi:hypothetical protein
LVLSYIRSCENQIWKEFRIFSQTTWVFAQNYELHSLYLLENVINMCEAIFSEMFGHNDFDSKSFTWFMPFLHHSCLKLMYPKYSFTTSSSCSDVWCVFFLHHICFTFLQLHPSSHITSASVLLFLHLQPLYYALLSQPIMHMKPALYVTSAQYQW